MHRFIVISILASATALTNAQPRGPTPDGDPLDVVTFASGSSRLMPGAHDRIEEIAAWHAEHPDTLLYVEGHASRAGSWTRNLLLSQERTDAVRAALVRAGADPARMVLVAHSENDAGDAEGSNRRVVIRATAAVAELAREQRDPITTEDARAEGRTMDQTRDDGGDEDRAAPSGGGTTIVIVPTGGGATAGGWDAPLWTGVIGGGASGTSEIGAGGATANAITGTAAGTGVAGGARGPSGPTGGAISGR
jgi:hypothetical protein